MSINAFKAGASTLDDATMNSMISLQDFSLIYTGIVQDSMTDAGTTANIVSDYNYAIKFTTGIGKTEVTRIELDLSCCGTAEDLTVEIRGNDFDPTGTEGTVLTTVTIPKEFIPTSQTYWSIPINLTGLTANTVYWIVVRKAGDNTNHVHLISKGSEKDTAHKCYKRTGDTGAWTDLSDSIRFIVYEGVDAEYLQDSMTDDATKLNLLYSYYYAVKFTTGAAQTEVTTLEFDMSKTGTGGGDFVYAIRGNDFNPAGTTLGTLHTTITVPAADIPTTEGFVTTTVNLTGLSPNTVYWIYLIKLGNSSNTYNFLSRGAEKDAAHKTYRRTGTTGAWTDAADSFRFKVYEDGVLQDSMTDVYDSHITTDSYYHAFSFTTGSVVHTAMYNTVHIELDVAAEGLGSDLIVSLRDSTFNINGSSDGVELATTTIPAASLPATKAYYEITLGASSPLTAETTYWVTISKTGSGTDRARFYCKSRLKSSAYKLYRRSGTSGAWSEAVDSIRFYVYEDLHSDVVHTIYGANGYTTTIYTSGLVDAVYRYIPPPDGASGGIRDIQTFTWSGDYLLTGVVT